MPMLLRERICSIPTSETYCSPLQKRTLRSASRGLRARRTRTGEGHGSIDLWVSSSENNASRIMGALKRFGAPLHQIEPRDFETPGTVFQIGVAPHRVDILTSMTP